jgi:hypothetical protein
VNVRCLDSFDPNKEYSQSLFDGTLLEGERMAVGEGERGGEKRSQ